MGGRLVYGGSLPSSTSSCTGSSALPLVQVPKGTDLIDETEIFKQMKALQRIRIVKITFYITLVLLLMIR